MAPVGRTTSMLPAGNGLLAGAGEGVGAGGLRRIKPEELSAATTFLTILLVVASLLPTVVLVGCHLRYLPTQYARICTGI